MSSENLREVVARELHKCFNETPFYSWEGLPRRRKEGFYNITSNILSHLKSQLEQMGNPYRAERVMREKQLHFDIPPSHTEITYEKAKQDILSKLQ